VLESTSWIRWTMAIVSLALGLALLPASIQFLRMRECGRQVLLVVSWAGVGYVLGSTAPHLFVWLRALSHYPGDPGVMWVIGAGLAQAAVEIIVISFIIRALRSRDVCNAMQA
jgi:hypothetical protein